jgi:hypothetical protein
MMKKLIILSACLIGSFLFSQVKIPKNSSKGSITTSTDLKINYTNLIYEKGKVTYINSDTKKEEFLFDNSIKNIIDYSNNITENTTEVASPIVENTFSNNKNQQNITDKNLKSSNFISNDDYLKAKKLSQLGTGFLVGGGACFLVGGILNLSAGSETVNSQNQTTDPKGSPVPLIIGLAGMGAGLVMKISGNSQMKKIKNSNVSLSKPVNEYYVITNNNGFGVKMKF